MVDRKVPPSETATDDESAAVSRRTLLKRAGTVSGIVGVSGVAGCAGLNGDRFGGFGESTAAANGTAEGAQSTGTPAGSSAATPTGTLSETTAEGEGTETTTQRPTETPARSAPTTGTKWYARYGMTPSNFQSRFDDYVGNQGLRLVDVSGYTVGGQLKYAAAWADIAGPAWKAYVGLTPSEFDQRLTSYLEDGYRLTDISAYGVNGQQRLAGIWQRYDGPEFFAYYGLSPSDYQSRTRDMISDGYRVSDAVGYSLAGSDQYAAIWEKYDGPEWYTHHDMSASQYQQKFDDYTADGLRATTISGFDGASGTTYVGTWQQFEGPDWRLRIGMAPSAFDEKLRSYAEEGFRLTDISGYESSGDQRLAAIWQREESRQEPFGGIDATVRSYMKSHDVVGLSLAIAKDERLVFRKGYGFANRDANDRMRHAHRLRIASISKAITGLATLKLVEDGALALDDDVFGSGGVLGTNYGTPTHGYATGGTTTSITVHNLLQHSSGWTNTRNGKRFDPMFRHPQKNQDELIRWVLENMPLKYEPGTWHRYLNFGYCLLGRVIEQASGKSYEQYVTDTLLTPAGIDGMEIAGNTRVDRRSDEAAYYGGIPYQLLVDRMDAHGGWLATPTDLLRLTVRSDGFGRKSDLLSSDTLTELSDVEGNWKEYGEGWLLRLTWRGHDGCMDGTAGWLVRRNDGVSFAFLANTRPEGDQCAGRLRDILHTRIDGIQNWPSHDLF